MLPIATADALTTGATDLITSLATTQGTVLLAAFGIVGGFVVFKLIKKAISKAG